MRNKSFFFIYILLSSIQLVSQDHTTQYDFDKAISLAQDGNKHVLMVFSGSDWCKPCIQLRKEILETDVFQSFRKKYLVHLELDFPYKKSNRMDKKQIKYNESLAEKYNPDGAFPKVLLFDSSKNIIKTIEYQKGMTPKMFINEIKIAIM